MPVYTLYRHDHWSSSSSSSPHVQPLPDDLLNGPFSPLWHAWLGLGESDPQARPHNPSSTRTKDPSRSYRQQGDIMDRTPAAPKVASDVSTNNNGRSWSNDRGGPPTFTMLVAGIVTAGLIFKSVSASRQARMATHEAESWRRVALRLLDRGEGILSHEEVDQVRRAKWVRNGCRPRASPILQQGEAHGNGANRTKMHHPNHRTPRHLGSRPETAARPADPLLAELRRPDRRPVKSNEEMINESVTMSTRSASIDKREPESAFGENDSLTEIDAHTAKVQGSSPLTATSSPSLKSWYAPIHPHEDWQWVPSDWPPTRSSWRRNRLPPWTIGFSREARAPRKAEPEEIRVPDQVDDGAHMQSIEAAVAERPTSPSPITTANKSDTPPRYGIEAAIKAHQSGTSPEELLFQSAAFPDAQACSTYDVESAFVVEEVLKEVKERQQKQALNLSHGQPISSPPPSPQTIDDCRNDRHIRSKSSSSPHTESETDNRPNASSPLPSASIPFASAQTPPSSSSTDADRIRSLEYQVWALLQRMEDVERFGQNGNNRRF